MVYRQKKTLYIVITLLAIFSILLIASNFISFPLQISTYSEVFPKEKWLLTRGGSGQIISNLIDFTQGHTIQYNISQFERGEFISVNFAKYLKGKKELSKGDSIAFIHSSDVRDQLVATEGELEVAYANLQSKSSAEKDPLIKEAENRLKYTDEKITEQKILLDRAKQLFEKGLCPQQEYELQKWNMDLLEIERRIFGAQVENLKTGVKPEEIRLLGSQVNAVKARLKFLKDRESQLLIVSPINGKIISSFSPDTLLNVVNYNYVVLHIPIKISDLPEFIENQTIQLSIPIIGKIYSGKILSLDKEIKYMNGQQVAFISVVLENFSNELLPGMMMENTIKLRNITLFKQLLRIIEY